MGISHLDHLYAETQNWGASVDFWEGLGFRAVSRWGDEGHRAGRFEAGSAAVVLAEVGEATTPQLNAFFGLKDAAEFAVGGQVHVVTPLEATHWNTRWIRVRDPDGRVFCLEEEGKE
jgi:catechol 2,3-dioxygenase-like lactoylglutathione lyase family enzyme